MEQHCIFGWYLVVKRDKRGTQITGNTTCSTQMEEENAHLCNFSILGIPSIPLQRECDINACIFKLSSVQNLALLAV